MYPHLVTATNVPKLVKIGDVNWDDVDAAFCCLPHATTQGTLASLPRHVKVVDLSADFRLQNVDTYAEWYACYATAMKNLAVQIFLPGLTTKTASICNLYRLCWLRLHSWSDEKPFTLLMCPSAYTLRSFVLLVELSSQGCSFYSTAGCELDQFDLFGLPPGMGVTIRHLSCRRRQFMG